MIKQFLSRSFTQTVEIHYYLGLEVEAQKYVSLLGYNYNTSEWYEDHTKF